MLIALHPISISFTTIAPNLRYILDTVAESEDEEERWKGVTTLQLLTRNGTTAEDFCLWSSEQATLKQCSYEDKDPDIQLCSSLY